VGRDCGKSEAFAEQDSDASRNSVPMIADKPVIFGLNGVPVDDRNRVIRDPGNKSGVSRWPAERLSMRKVRDVPGGSSTPLGMSFRQISEATGNRPRRWSGEYVPPGPGVIGITWPVPEEIDDAELETAACIRFCARTGPTAGRRSIWRKVHEEMKRPRRDAGAAVAGSNRGAEADGTATVTAVYLRPLWRIGARTVLGDDAPDAPGPGRGCFVDYAGDTVSGVLIK